MYLSHNNDSLWLDIWVPDFLLQPSLFLKMSNNNKRASKETSGSVGSKKKKQLQQSTLISNGDKFLKGQNKAHIGKQLLIPAKVLYSSGRVPFGQEDYLFQYSVRSVNKDHKTLVIQYDERCISTDSDAFQDFPLHDENE